MKNPCGIGISCVLGAVLLTGAGLSAQAEGPTLWPVDQAAGINPDTHLVLTFDAAPTVGKSGSIRVYDMAGHRLVDTLDMSVPAGPDPAHRVALPADAIDPNPPTPTTTTPAVRTTPADLHSYQLNTIGGLEDFHFYPVLVHGKTATITLHSHVLQYGHRYRVEIDPAVFGGSGWSWTFATKKAGPPANAVRVVVAADGSGDFNTVQGAADFLPDSPAKRVTVLIKNGTYEEIVFFRHKSNVTFRGEDRDKVLVGYGNNSAFNPPMPGPSRRCAFSVYDSSNVELTNLSISNFIPGQAEGLLIYGSKNVVSRVTIKGQAMR